MARGYAAEQASTMHASSLPRQPHLEASITNPNDLLDAIEKGATKEKKKSMLKLKSDDDMISV